MIEVTGHRGARGLAPENTMAGFRLALELGCDAVEFDIQLTRDGNLAVIHDSSIDRTTGGTGTVASYTMEELKTFDAGQGEQIPDLGEVLDLLKSSNTRAQIELKGPGTEQAAAELVNQRGMKDKTMFTSFFHRRVVAVKQMLPGTNTGVLISCNPVNPVEILEACSADNLHVNQGRIDACLVEAVHRAGRRIVAWGNIVEESVIDRLIGLGVDAIGSDRPDLVIKRLRN